MLVRELNDVRFTWDFFCEFHGESRGLSQVGVKEPLWRFRDPVVEITSIRATSSSVSFLFVLRTFVRCIKRELGRETGV